MRIILASSSTYFANCLTLRIESSALSHGTSVSLADTRPETSSPIIIFLPETSANMTDIYSIGIFSKFTEIGKISSLLEPELTSMLFLTSSLLICFLIVLFAISASEDSTSIMGPLKAVAITRS